MKKYLIIAIVLLCGLVASGIYHIDNVTKKWKLAEANMRAYDSQLSSEKKKSAAFQLTVKQLQYFNDSVFQALDATRKELHIKDKNLKALQAIVSGFTKKDTITIVQVDTLFKDPTLAIDTLIGDEWYNVQLGLKYPSMIAVKPYFKSEKHVVVSSKKETVNKPKKFFLFRWFQRKMTVVHVDVVEKNPYSNNESSTYVEILK